MSNPIAESRALDGAARTPLSNSALAWCGSSTPCTRRLECDGGMVGVLFATARSEYVNFRLGRFDFGNMVQAIWSTAQGRPLQVTNVSGDEVSRLSIHIDPVLALFAPSGRRFRCRRRCSSCESWRSRWERFPCSGSRGATSHRRGSHRFWRSHTSPIRGSRGQRSSRIRSRSRYLFFSTASGRSTPTGWSRFVPFAALAALTGELVGLTLALIGLWYAFSRGRRRAGLVIALLGIGWSLFAVYVVVPAFSGSGSAYYGYFVGVGGSPQGVVRTLFTHPGAIASALFTGRDVLYVLALALPLGGLFVLARGLPQPRFRSFCRTASQARRR